MTYKNKTYQVSSQINDKENGKYRKYFGMSYLLLTIGFTCSIIGVTFITYLLFQTSPKQLEKLAIIDSTSSNVTLTNYITLNFDQDDKQQLWGEIISTQGVEVAQFLGIRYAEKPRRFKKTKLARGWSGLYDGLNWPPFCIQNKIDPYYGNLKIYNNKTSEDCLYMNIWTSHLDVVGGVNQTKNTPSKSANNLLPVILYIHGGSFFFSGISQDIHNGATFAALGKVVFVTFNYRLGLFGFFNNNLEHIHQEYIKNAGLHDQILAIEWVRSNIHNFGGDPNLLTIDGHSAGAISVGLHMVSPFSAKYFQRAILQSASPMMIKQLFTAENFEQIISLANCTIEIGIKNDTQDEDESVDDNDDNEDEEVERRLLATHCLEKASVDSLIKLQGTMLANDVISFAPSLPSMLFPEPPEEAMAKGISQHDVLLGATGNESAIFMFTMFPRVFSLIDSLNVSQSDLVQSKQQIFGNNTLMNNLISLILNEITKNGFKNEQELTSRFYSFFSDLLFKGPVFKFANSLKQNIKNNVYLYLFNESVDSFPKWLGVGHGMELYFQFGLPLSNPDKYTPEQRELSVRIIRTWATFAKTGKMLPQFGMNWPQVGDNGMHMTLRAENGSIGNNLDMSYYSFFDITYDAF